MSPVDVVIDAAGGLAQQQAIRCLRRGGFIDSAVSQPDRKLLDQQDATGTFILVKVTTHGLRTITDLVEHGALSTFVGTVLPIDQSQIAHQMLDGVRPYARGKIVLTMPGYRASVQKSYAEPLTYLNNGQHHSAR